MTDQPSSQFVRRIARSRIQRSIAIALMAVAPLAALAPQPSSAQGSIRSVLPSNAEARTWWTCAGSAIRVQTELGSEAKAICDGARGSLDQLRSCGLHPRNDLAIEVTDDVLAMSNGKIVGDYLPGVSRVRIASQAAIAARPAGATQTLVPALDYYSSIAAHVVAHAVFHDATEHLDLPRVAHEYVAYALQIATLPKEARDRLMTAGTVKPASHLYTFSPFLLLADPEQFAILAYSHFSQPVNGCAFLTRIIKREQSFPPESD